MKIHYFQRYHQKENVVTANTMLLLQRLFLHSPTKYYNFLEDIVDANAETTIELQTKVKNGSIPDAAIKQPSVNVVVETKLSDSFDILQLKNHMKSFGTEDHQILLTLCSISSPKTLNKAAIDCEVKNFNSANKTHIVHKHITFEDIVIKMESLITQADTDMFAVFNDFKEFCIEEGLIPHIWMKIRAVATTMKDNLTLNLYYHSKDRHHMDGHKFIGLYANKKVQYVGEIVCKVVYDATTSTFTPDHQYTHYYTANKVSIEKRIIDAISNSIAYGYNLHTVPHRYFIVEGFEPTNFEKETNGGLFGERSIDLTETVKAKETDKASDIARKLTGKKWR